ncbi:MAG: DUF4837 family protein [Bacteroidales bacterium]|nr:DUF4837 family protein [Bacteroidales bacterium]
MKKYIQLISILILAVTLGSCKLKPGEQRGSSSSGLLLPNVSGTAGEVLVVMDNFNWKNKAGEILRKTLEQEYPALTQPEPLFDLIHITAGAFDNIFQIHRTVLTVNIEESIPEATLRYSENVWAKPQLVIRLDAPNGYALETLLEKERDNILRNILSYDRKRIQDVYNDSKDPEIRNIVSKFNISLAVPRGYNIDMNNDEFASFSIETAKTSQVIFVYQYPSSGKNSLSTSEIIDRRNEFLQKYTRGSRMDSYITTTELFPPETYDIVRDGREIAEVRGWWELFNGYMGGPFLSHSTILEKSGKVVVVEGYVYNPNNKKRNMMRQLEAIIYSMKVIE